MKDVILEKLYYCIVNNDHAEMAGDELSLRKQQDLCYEKILKEIPVELKETFIAFVDNELQLQANREKVSYIKGIKIGCKLIREMLDT